MGIDVNTSRKRKIREVLMDTKQTCGAKTRTGAPCKNTRLYTSGRCKNHGGLSTGPKTEEGKARALANLRGDNRTP